MSKCVSSCLFLLLAWQKHLSQLLHLLCLPPICVLSWLFLLLTWLKRFSQYWHVVYYRYVSFHVDSCYRTDWCTCHNTNIYVVSDQYLYKLFHVYFLLRSRLKNFSQYWHLKPEVGKTSVLTWTKLHKCPYKDHHVNECYKQLHILAQGHNTGISQENQNDPPMPLSV